MAKTTGIILATGGITLVNKTVLQEKEMDWRIPIATGFAAMGFVLIEKVNPKFATGAAWIALVTVLFVRTDPKTPSPTESLVKYWKEG